MSPSAQQPLPPLPAAIDEVITAWPDVHGKNVFGHRGWVRHGMMIGFIADDGIAVKALSSEHSCELYARDGAKPFFYNGTTEMKGWPVLPLHGDADVSEVLSELQRVYDTIGA